MKSSTGESIRKTRDELENKFRKQIEELTRVNEKLKLEIIERKKVEDELNKSEENLRLIYNTTGDVLFQLQVEPNDRFRFSSVNLAFLTSTGLTEEQIVGKTTKEIIPESSHTLALEKYKEAIRDQRTVRWEETTEYPSGVKVGDVAVAPAFDEDGNCTHLIGSVRDITERKRVEERFLGVLESAPDAMVITDEDGIIQLINKQTEKLFGYEQEELLGEKVQKLMPQRFRTTHSNHQKNYKSNPKSRAMGEGLELLGLRKDGEEFPIEISLSPIETHEDLLVIAAIRDITQRQREKDILLESERSLAEAQRIAHLGSWEWDILTNKITWSDEIFRIFGLAQQHFEVTYYSFLDRIHPNDRGSVEEAVNRILADSETEYNIQHRIIRPDGTERIVQERGEVKLGEDGRPVLMIGTMHDLTEFKRIEAETLQLRDELAHLDRVGKIGAMASAIAHEINQPLAAILSNSQAALRLLNINPPDLNEVREALTDIADADKRAGEVIRRIRAMVKKEELHREPYNINTIINEVIELVQSEVVIQNVSIRTNLEPRVPILSGDNIQMQQVILNLIMNALEAVKNQPIDARHIVIATSIEDKKSVEVRVTDSGPGVDEDNIENIFDAFYTTKTQGMGLGLSVCYSIIENHGGRLWAENCSGGGAKFSFRLPLTKDDD